MKTVQMNLWDFIPEVEDVAQTITEVNVKAPQKVEEKEYDQMSIYDYWEVKEVQPKSNPFPFELYYYPNVSRYKYGDNETPKQKLDKFLSKKERR